MDKKCFKKLKQLIEEVVLPDVEDYIDDVFETIANNKNASKEEREDLEEMHEFRQELKDVLEELNNNTMDLDECVEFYEELNLMIKGVEDDEDE